MKYPMPVDARKQKRKVLNSYMECGNVCRGCTDSIRLTMAHDNYTPGYLRDRKTSGLKVSTGAAV